MLRRQSGDTIIEVLMAITIFSMVGVGAISIMNQGTNAAQRALEITQVRHQVDAQAEALRAVHQAYSVNPGGTGAMWASIAAPTDTSTWSEDQSCPSTAADVGGSFIMDPSKASVLGGQWLSSINDSNAPPHAQVIQGSPSTAYGMWIERTRHVADGARSPVAYDFNIRACWYSAGMPNTPSQIETLVRLYDPS